MIFITGASGLVGSQLAYDLLKKGRKVRALKRKNTSLDVFKKHFTGEPHLLNGLEWFEGDVLDVFSIEEALEGITDVYHCAAKISFDPADYHAMMEVNIRGTANVVNCCLEKGIRKLCHVSSVAAIGRSREAETITEDSLWQTSRHNSNYSVSKYGAEREVWRGIAEGLDAVIVNPTVVMGLGNWEEGSSSMIKKVYEGLRFYTRGVNGFVDAGDVSKAMIWLMESYVKNERFILNAESISYHNFFTMAAGFLNKEPPSRFAGPFLSSIAWRAEKIKSLVTGGKPLITRETARTANNRYYYSNEKIKKLGFEFIPVRQSLEKVCRQFLSEQT
jgi:nucleoside-diphosphate-sugar epimerase